MFDPSAKILTAHASNHANEILDLYFYDKQTQMVSISADRIIILWDSLKLEPIQTIRDQMPQARSFSSTTFNAQKGMLLTACIHVKLWKAKVDPQVEFQAIQRKAITSNALKGQVTRL